MRKVLFVDDQAYLWTDRFNQRLGKYGLCFIEELDADNTIRRIRKDKPHVVLLDIMFDKKNKGLPTLKKIRLLKDPPPVVMITTTFDSEPYTGPTEFEKAGAVFCICKSDLERGEESAYKHLADRLNEAVEMKNMQNAMEKDDSLGFVVGHSEKMKQIAHMILQVAKTNASVLITGESGTGKEMVARAIHNNSPRRTCPFIEKNMAALPSEHGGLAQSDVLFGHASRTPPWLDNGRPGIFESANGGTVFLDEIGDSSPEVQKKLLRVLQERIVERIGSNTPINVDVRLLAATNRDLTENIRNGKFREDLYYRLNVMPIHLPPLRERKEDFKALFEHFIQELNPELGKSVKTVFRPDVENLFRSYSWPGNIREYKNAIERAMIIARSTILEAGHFSFLSTSGNPESQYMRPEEASAKVLKKELTYSEIMDVDKMNMPRKGAWMKEMLNELIPKIIEKEGTVSQKLLAKYFQTNTDNIKQVLKDNGLRLLEIKKAKKKTVQY